MTEAPKCEDCRCYIEIRSQKRCASAFVTTTWSAIAARGDERECGFKGRFFQPKEGKRDE